MECGDDVVMQYEVKEVDTKSPHGIYVYDKVRDLWILVKSDGEAFEPTEDGVYVIYFDNTKCPACRKYDTIWFPFVKKWSKDHPNHRFVIILCDWFARECKSQAASSSFRKYNIHASPTTVFMYVKDGKKVYDEKYEGVLYEFELKLILEGFEERAKKYLRGEKVEVPVKKESIEASLQKLIAEIIKQILASQESKSK